MFIEAEAASARALAALGVFHARGAEGALSSVSWLRHELHVSHHDARRLVDAAVVSAEHPVIGQAHAAGSIGLAHVHELATAAKTLDPAVMVQAAPLLVQVAQSAPPVMVRRAVERIEHTLDPGGDQAADQSDVGLFEQRYLQVATTFDGAVHIQGLLDPETGALLMACLSPLAAPRVVDGEPETRTGGQRNADALAELCTRALGAGNLPSGAGRSRTSPSSSTSPPCTPTPGKEWACAHSSRRCCTRPWARKPPAA